MSPTTLVNEVWLKLAALSAIRTDESPAFQAESLRARCDKCSWMRLAVDALDKRGGADAVFVTFDDSVDQPALYERDLLALDRALDDLARNPSAPGDDGGRPFFWRARRRRNRSHAPGLGSDNPSRLAGGEGVARQ
jgi:hypothetical protein